MTIIQTPLFIISSACWQTKWKYIITVLGFWPFLFLETRLFFCCWFWPWPKFEHVFFGYTVHNQTTSESPVPISGGFSSPLHLVYNIYIYQRKKKKEKKKEILRPKPDQGDRHPPIVMVMTRPLLRRRARRALSTYVKLRWEYIPPSSRSPSPQSCTHPNPRLCCIPRPRFLYWIGWFGVRNWRSGKPFGEVFDASHVERMLRSGESEEAHYYLHRFLTRVPVKDMCPLSSDLLNQVGLFKILATVARGGEDAAVLASMFEELNEEHFRKSPACLRQNQMIMHANPRWLVPVIIHKLGHLFRLLSMDWVVLSLLQTERVGTEWTRMSNPIANCSQSDC